VSDCGAVEDITDGHIYTDNFPQGAAVSFEAGMDMTCENYPRPDIAEAWDQRLLSIDLIDRSLIRLFEGLVRTGYFDGHKSKWAKLGWKDVNTPEAQRLALEAAVEGIVLLKNDSTLP
jgi:beta-D-xylosidase 4